MPQLQNLITAWQSLSRVAKHVILILSLVISVVLFGLGCGWFARYESRIWLCQYDMETDSECASLANNSLLGAASKAPSPNSSPVVTPSPHNANLSASSTPSPTDGSNASLNPASTATATPTPPPPPTPLTKEQENRLMTQAIKVNGLIRHHARVMSFFYRAYYTAISVLMFAGAFAAIAMFFIAMRGWGSANEYVKTLFVVMTVAAAFYGLWPPVFQQEKNISDNKALFLEYERLQNEIASYPVTRSNIKNEHKEPNDFIAYVDSEFASLGNIAIGFDYSKISYRGAFESNSNSSTPSSSPTAPPKKTP